jgi:hypothetical protein
MSLGGYGKTCCICIQLSIVTTNHLLHPSIDDNEGMALPPIEKYPLVHMISANDGLRRQFWWLMVVQMD